MYDSNLQDPWHLVSQLSATFDFPEMLKSAHQRVKEPPDHKCGSLPMGHLGILRSGP